MRISDLRECVVLAETRSFTDTARRLYTTQSAVSKHIQALEQDLNTQLFVRNQNGVYLAEAGKLFVSNAQRILWEYSESIAALDRLKSGVEGTLNVGYLAGASFAFLPETFNAFSSRFPNIEIQPKTMEIDGIIDGLDSDGIDVGITTELVSFSNSRFETMPLYADHISVIVPKGHRLATRESVSIKDLAGETILLPNSTFMVREAPLIESLLVPIAEKVVVKQNVNDVMALFLLMMTGRYVTILFDHVRNFSDFGLRFKFLELEEYPTAFNIVAVWRKSAKSEAVVAMAETLRDVVALRGGVIEPPLMNAA